MLAEEDVFVTGPGEGPDLNSGSNWGRLSRQVVARSYAEAAWKTATSLKGRA